MVGGHEFEPGTLVFSKSRNRPGSVVRAERSGAELWYQVFFGNRDTPLLPATDLAEHHESPLDKLLNGEHILPMEFDLMTLGLDLQVAYTEDPHASLSSSRLEPQPHQVFVTHKAVSALYPRLLLADEVGLGKTIEAGMILKELKARGLVKRTLILSPASLVTQWIHEMQSKFNERFMRYDAGTVNVLQREHIGENVWQAHDQVICSIQFARDDSRIPEIAEAGWDLVIIDEAHHARRSQETAGRLHRRKAYDLASQVSDPSKALLLLTATPLQLQDYEFYSLLALLDPGVFPTYEHFRKHSDARRHINRLLRRVEAFHTLSPEEKELVLEELGERLGNGRAPEELRSALATESGRQDMADRLADKDVLANLMIRNRKRVIGGFTQRQVHTISVDMTDEERNVYEEMWHYIRRGYRRSVVAGDMTLGFVMVTFQKLLTSSPYALEHALARRIARLSLEEKDGRLPAITDELDDETEGLFSDTELDDRFQLMAGYASGDVPEEIIALRKLKQMVENLTSDSKLDALQTALKPILQQAEQKVLIFTQFKRTLDYLRSHLEPRYRVAVFHGDLDTAQKDKAVEVFEDHAQIMISTEAGGEGRNFQFCNCLINYDLPWNPMRVEQRIGRLDRIGQKRDVFVYNFALTGTIESRVVEVLKERIQLFEDSVGMLDPILGSVERDLMEILMQEAPDMATCIHRVEVALEDKVRRAEEAESRMSDFLMDRASFRRDTSAQILGRKASYTSTDIERFLELFFARFRSECFKRNPDGTLDIDAPPVWEVGHRDIYGRSPYHGTCSPALAIANERLAFFAFGHPVFEAAISDVAEEFAGGASSRVCGATSRPGSRILQAQVLYEFRGVRPFRRAVTIWVDIDTGEWDPAFSYELARSPSKPTPGPKVSEADVPRVREAWDLIGDIARKTSVELQDGIAPENRRLYEKQRQRLQSQYDYRVSELTARLATDRAILVHIETSGTEIEKRILPARAQGVRATEQLIETVTLERDDRLADLDSRQNLSPALSFHSLCLVSTI